MVNMNMKNCEHSTPLSELTKWRLEASEENNTRYFYTTPYLPAVLDGEACFVIGRKGSGKTAIAEYIRGIGQFDVFVRNLSFKNFPFNEMYALADGRFTTSSQYITIWKYIIYCAICERMSQNEKIDPTVSAPLRSIFSFDFSSALLRNITYLARGSFSLNILKGGLSGSASREILSNDMPWIERVDALEKLLLEFLDDSKYYVVFDELDEDYKNMVDIERKDQYFDLLTGLLKAVIYTRNLFRNKKNIIPIIFLRDDIYDIIEDNDKNKFDDLTSNLSWNQHTLETITAFRISRAIDASGPIYDFSKALGSVFESKNIRHGRNARRARPIFRHILDRTLLRPRDVICYLRESAILAIEKREPIITTAIIREADARYSRRFRREFVDEMHSVVPHINDIFGIFSKIRKQVLTVEEFSKEYAEIKRKKKGALDFDLVCRFLFHFSVIGNLPAQTNTNVFKYIEQNAEMNFRENIIIHRGLLKSLQIR